MKIRDEIANSAKVVIQVKKEWKKRYVMLIDLSRCTGCSTCSIACKSENDVPLGCFRTWVNQYEKGNFPVVNRFFLPLMCNQCDNPHCVRVCPVKASFQRDDGIVDVNPHTCLGCKICMVSCPYNMRYLNPERRYVQKCNFCLHRLDKEMKPACVEACPSQALIFGDIQDKNSRVSQMIRSKNTQKIKVESGTGPQVYYLHLDQDTVVKGEGVRNTGIVI